MTKSEIKEIVTNGIGKEYSHVIIYCDHWDYTYNSKYVKEEEDIHKTITNITSHGSPGMFTIEEVYNYNLDINMQLNERRAYHIDPSIKKQKTKNSIEIEALEYATKMHKGQYRKDGLEYITHPIKVAEYVKKFKESSNLEILVAAAYLHDTIEDTEATYYNIVEKFGPEVAHLVLEVTTDEDLKNEIGKTRYLEIKMKNMSSWALVIKLCDRLANICDLEEVDDNFRKKYITETIEILNYVTDNRNLSKTHIKIMQYILYHIAILNYEYPVELENSKETISSVKRKIKSLDEKKVCV